MSLLLIDTKKERKKRDSEKPKPQKRISILQKMRHYLVMCIFPGLLVTHIAQNKKGSPLVPLPEWKICEEEDQSEGTPLSRTTFNSTKINLISLK